MDIDLAIEHINEAGALLAFPIKNQRLPPSLWSAFFPRSLMRWEWDEDGDQRVADLWYLRAELSAAREIVYAKWYQGRATFIARDVYTCMLRVIGAPEYSAQQLSANALKIYELLCEDSPQSPRVLRDEAGLTTSYFARDYERAVKMLWANFLIVGDGEIDDGAFPSLALGATKLIYEDLWNEAKEMDITAAWRKLQNRLGEGSLFLNYLMRQVKRLRPPTR